MHTLVADHFFRPTDRRDPSEHTLSEACWCQPFVERESDCTTSIHHQDQIAIRLGGSWRVTYEGHVPDPIPDMP